MAALQIRDVPEGVRLTLVDRAAARGQSLQAFLLSLVTDEARRSSNLATLERFAHRDDGSQLSASEMTRAIDLGRAERDRQLTGDKQP